jgi:hypothetical protein
VVVTGDGELGFDFGEGAQHGEVVTINNNIGRVSVW